VALDPLHEPAQQALMWAYAQAGQRAAALRQYEECTRVLEEELGLPPAPETTALGERIRAGRVGSERAREVDAEVEREPAPASSPTLPHNLPAQATPFVGRAEERAEVVARLRDPGCRLLTVVGPGGMGKTRLAIQAAEDLVAAGPGEVFEQGIWFVPLAPVQTPAGIVPAIAQALGLSLEGGAPRQQLLDYLCQRNLLLVLDNVEHLLAEHLPARPRASSDGAVALVSEIIKRAPQVVVLATSRAHLNAHGEHLLHLGGMDTPRSLPPASTATPQEALQYSAVQLFVQGARRVRSDFELRAEDVAPVGRICRLVHGMPLGLLLAAAWVEMLSPAEIARELAAEIQRSLDFLAADWRDLPKRQRSIRAVYDHSWRLLSEREQEVFRALSVFRGTFSRTAAQAVSGASLRELMSLTRKSLLHRTPAGRFEVHELLRQYAEEKLEASPEAAEEARDRYAGYYAAALQRWYREMTGPRQKGVLPEMDAELGNIRAAWHWMAERRQAARLNQAADGLGLFTMWRKRHQEGDTLCLIAAQGVSTSKTWLPTDTADRLCALSRILAWRAWFVGDIQVRRKLLQESFALLDRPELAGVDTRSERAFVLSTMVRLRLHPEYEQAERAGQESQALYESLSDQSGVALLLENWGLAAESYGALEEAQTYLGRSLELRRSLGDRLGMATCLKYLSWGPTLLLGHFERAEHYARESLAIRRELLGAPGDGLEVLGWAVAHQGRYEEARSMIESSVRAFEDRGAWDGHRTASIFLGVVEAHLARYAQAREIGRLCLESCRQMAFFLAVLGMAALGAGEAEVAWRLLEESVAIYQESEIGTWQSWALALPGYAARKLGRLRQARQRFVRALRMASEIKSLLSLLYALPGVAALLADRSGRSTPDVERAVEVYALATRYPFVANSRWFEDVAGVDVAAAAEALPPEVVAAAQARGRAADPWAMAEELLRELEEQVSGP
jgi:predicted ATPase